MSVLAGYWSLDGNPADRNMLSRMNENLAKYGPDGETTYFDRTAGLLYRPFHTTPEARFETQPYQTADGKILVWDGRLDNRAELILELRNELQECRTNVDIVAAAFRRWGTNCFGKFVGEWALAIWDRVKPELVLVRDYIGTKNLFYYRTSRHILWANYLSALAVCGGRFRLNEEYIAGYLAFQPAAHLTPYQEISSVPPGHFARLTATSSETIKHWTFEPRHRIHYKTDADYEEHFRTLFRQAVQRRLRVDSPVLAELSGGLDSSSVVCMAHLILQEDRKAQALHTFSCFDPAEPAEDDFHYFVNVEKRLGKNGFHAKLETTGDSFGLAYQNFVAIPCLGERREMRSAREQAIEQTKCKVVLSGTGGDEFLGQAFDPRAYMADLLKQGRFSELWKQMTAWSLPMRRPLLQLMLQLATWFAPPSVRARFAAVAQVETWIDSRFAHRHKLSYLLLDPPEAPKGTPTSVAEMMSMVRSIARQLTNSLPAAYEVRYPYLDQSLTEFLISVPIDQLVRPGERRSLMRRALAGILPQEITSRRTKAKTSRCYSVTLMKHWQEIENSIHSPVIADLGYVNASRFAKALEEMKNGCIPPGYIRLLRALVLEHWIRDTVARGIISIPAPTLNSLGKQTPAVKARP